MRMIHIRLPEHIHKELRIHAAEKDITIQDWVSELIEKELTRKETQSTHQQVF